MDNISLNIHVNSFLNDILGQDQSYMSLDSLDKIEININIDKESMSVRDIAVYETTNDGECSIKRSESFTSIPSLEYLEYTVNDVSNIDSNIDGECCICINTFNRKKHKKRCLLSCGHSFCEVCLSKILENQTVCPLCQTELLHKKYMSRYSQSI